MPRGRKRTPPPALPSGGYYKALVDAALLLREGVISTTEFALYNLISMFDWDWDNPGVRVTEFELARWLRVHRETVNRMMKKLIGLGLVKRTEKGELLISREKGEGGRVGICVTCKSRDLGTSLLKPNMVVVDKHTPSPGEISLSDGEAKHALGAKKVPPPPNSSKMANLCDAQITGFTNHVNSTSHKLEIPPEILGFARYIGLQTTEGLQDLARYGQPPGVLLAVWRSVPDGAENRIGLFFYRLANLDPGLVPRPDYSVRFCPVCGERLAPGEGCPGGHRFRACECGELAPEGEPCRWCGALPPEEQPEPEEPEPEPEDAPIPEQDAEAQKLWEQALAVLRGKLAKATFAQLAGTRGLALGDGTLVVAVPSGPIRELLEARLAGLIRRTISDVTGRDMEVKFTTKL